MFVEDVIQFTKENYNEICLVYPQQSNNSVVIPFRNITIEIAWKSLKCHNGKKPNQDRILLYYNENESIILAGIFDGHGNDGHTIASFIRESFFISFIQLFNNNQLEIDLKIEKALQMAIQNLQNEISINSKRSGCTASILFFHFNQQNNLIINSLNIGDSECILYNRDKNEIKQINVVHSPDLPQEYKRITEAGGFINSFQLKSYLPIVSRVFANHECTKGGLTMSRSIGDSLLHKYGISSIPTIDCITCDSSYQNCTLFIILGSDGFLSYVEKEQLVPFFQDTISITNSLDSSLQFAFNHLLKQTNNHYADDTSGIVFSFHL